MGQSKTETLVEEIGRDLRAGAGGTTADMRQIRRRWSRTLRAESGSTIITLARRLAPEGFWPRFIGYELILFHPSAPDVITSPDITALGRNLADWASVDCFGCYVAGPAWREGRIPTSLIRRWTRSTDRWQRRAALVATVPLNLAARGGTGDAKRTLEICRLLIADRDDMVVKAMSWALRSLVPRDRRAVERFLRTHEEDLAPRVRREVRTKLLTGKKN